MTSRLGASAAADKSIFSGVAIALLVSELSRDETAAVDNHLNLVKQRWNKFARARHWVREAFMTLAGIGVGLLAYTLADNVPLPLSGKLASTLACAIVAGSLIWGMTYDHQVLYRPRALQIFDNAVSLAPFSHDLHGYRVGLAEATFRNTWMFVLGLGLVMQFPPSSPGFWGMYGLLCSAWLFAALVAWRVEPDEQELLLQALWAAPVAQTPFAEEYRAFAEPRRIQLGRTVYVADFLHAVGLELRPCAIPRASSAPAAGSSASALRLANPDEPYLDLHQVFSSQLPPLLR